MTTVKHTLDPKNPPKMTEAEKAHFDALGDGDIDYSDAPELDAEFWANAEVREPTQRKDNVSVRVDAATLDFFKGSDPKGYSRRMAEVLSAYARAKQPKQG